MGSIFGQDSGSPVQTDISDILSICAARKVFGKGDPIYLDYGGTSPVDPSVFDSMTEFFVSNWENPSSSHVHGQVTRFISFGRIS